MNAITQIFLSYAREDEEKVDNLYLKLSDEGFKPWMDKKDILPGEKWELSIQQALRNSHFFLACLSTMSVKKRGILQREMKEALDFTKEKLSSDIYIIPARLEECEIPSCLSQFQYVDLFKNSGWPLLIKAIRNGMACRPEANPDFAKPTLLEIAPIQEGLSYDPEGLVSNPTIKVEMIFKMKPEQFDEQFRMLLMKKLAAFLDISSEFVLITSVKKGSVKVIIELPKQSAEMLLYAFKRNDSELIKHLAPLMHIEFHKDKVEPERIQQMKFQVKVVQKRVLVVDDNKYWRNELKECLDHLKYQVDTASKIKEAIHKLDKHSYDLIISDIFLDEYGLSGEGGRFFNILNAEYKTLPVIAITGEPRPIPITRIRDLFIEYGIVDLIHKSAFDVKEFQKMVMQRIEIANNLRTDLEIQKNFKDIKTELLKIKNNFNSLSQKEQIVLENALELLKSDDSSEELVKQRLEICIPLIPLFINWKAEIDLNKIASRTLRKIDFVTLEGCEKVINSWYSLKHLLRPKLPNSNKNDKFLDQ